MGNYRLNIMHCNFQHFYIITYLSGSNNRFYNSTKKEERKTTQKEVDGDDEEENERNGSLCQKTIF